MKIRLQLTQDNRRGYALAVVLAFTAASLLILGGALSWTSSNSSFNERNNQYFNTVAAAEAATEKVLSRMSRDFQTEGESLVYASLSDYRTLVPTVTDNSYWADYEFSDASGSDDRTRVERVSSAMITQLQSQYQGLYGLAASYRFISNARKLNSSYDIAVGLKQDVQVACIPIFQFAIFYGIDLEINPGPPMVVTGKVHSNVNLYTEPSGNNQLTFQGDVTAAGKIYPHKKPGDPLSRNSTYNVTYQKEHDAGVSAMTLPVGTNNSPAAVHAILEVPPVGESPTSAMGKQRYYNKSDLVILVSNSVVVVKSGYTTNFGITNFVITIPWSEAKSFLSTNVTFYNKRELKTVKTTQIDVAQLKTWSETNKSLRGSVTNVLLGRDIRSVYVADFRTQTGTTQPGVKVVNGETLPSMGLTVSTPNPLYVQGHYNAPSSHLGTTNTTLTMPASLVGDSINVLSSAWDDANSNQSLSSRNAAHTTVNAAFLAGIVPTTSGSYSGGVENFPRFLENWSGDTFTYNGSMVVLFESATATAPWGGSDVYSPPSRNWAFDRNFLDATKLPPATPEVRAIIRGTWQVVKAGTTD